MSGIVGVYHRDGQAADPLTLQQMTDALIHRGPDGVHSWRKDSVALAHLMLRTTPESLHERLPIVACDGAYVLTADARIDNRAELLRLLDLHERPTTITDSELIAAAYERWGERCPEQLVGDFAFAIWDDRRQRLFCARDHFGVRPFYYYATDDRFVFGSEIKALLCGPAAPRKLNERSVGDYLAALTEDVTSTFYAGIVRLPPAHSLTVDRASMQLRRYYQLDPATELRLESDEHYAARFRELLSEAVACRLRSGVPVGALLSGGLDSSSIVCVASDLVRQLGAEPLQTFSAIFPSLPAADLAKIDERRYIDAVVAKTGVHAHAVHADQLSPLGGVEQALHHQDEPYVAPNLFMNAALYDAASQRNVRIVLDGFAGDSVVSHGLALLGELAFAGRWRELVREARALGQRYDVPLMRYIESYGLPYFTKLARRRQWISYAREARELARQTGVSTRSLFFRHGLGRALLNEGVKPLAPAAVRRIGRARRGAKRAAVSQASRPLIRSSFAQRIGLAARIEAQRASAHIAETARAEHVVELSSGALVFALEEMGRLAAARSVEPCFPYLDKRLVEFCLAIPAEQKLSQGWTRSVMRRAMEQVLPPAVQWRLDKGDLSPNFTRGMLTDDRARVDGVLLGDLHSMAPFVDGSILRAAYQRYVERRSPANELLVWKAVVLAEWLRGTGLQP